MDQNSSATTVVETLCWFPIILHLDLSVHMNECLFLFITFSLFFWSFFFLTSAHIIVQFHITVLQLTQPAIFSRMGCLVERKKNNLKDNNKQSGEMKELLGSKALTWYC